MDTMEMWISSRDLATLAGIAPQNVRKAIDRGTWRGCRLVIRQADDASNPGTPRYEIRLDSLPPDIQYAWRRRAAGRPVPAQDLAMLPIDDSIKARAIRMCLDAPGLPTVRAAARMAMVNVSTVYRWVDQARKAGQLPQTTLTAGGARYAVKLPQSSVPEEIFCAALALLLNQPRAPLTLGYEVLTRAGVKLSYAQFTRLLKQIEPRFEDLRLAESAGTIPLYLQKTPKIIRSWLQIPAGHTYIGDQHLLDYAAVLPETGEVVLLQLYLWMDATSRYWTGLAASFGAYSQYTVGTSLLDACALQMPEQLYTDWGRPENSVYINELRQRLSGWIGCGDWEDFRAQHPDAEITRKHSTPYVPPVKPIEAQMAVLTRYLAQENLTGYRKRDLANPFVNKKVQADLAAAKRGDRLPTVPELLATIVKVAQRHNDNPARTEEGPTIIPAEIFWQGIAGRRRVLPEQDLRLLLFPAVERTVRNSTVRVSVGKAPLEWTAPELALLPAKERVRVHYNPMPPHEGAVISRWQDDQWRFYCIADPWYGHGVHPEDQEKLSALMEIKQRYLKQFRQSLKQIHVAARERIGAAESAQIIQLTDVAHFREAHQRHEDTRPRAGEHQAALLKLVEVKGGRA